MPETYKTEVLHVTVLRIDGGTQSRVEMSPKTVAEYREALVDGAKFPPLDVFHDGKDYWMADGFHRLKAHKLAGIVELECRVHPGGVSDAILFSLGANRHHGLRRSNADKHNVVEMMLRHPKAADWSNYKIADHCAVSEFLVREIRLICDKTQIAPTVRTVERGGTTYQMNTAGIGANSQPAAEPTPAGGPVSPEQARQVVEAYKKRASDLARSGDIHYKDHPDYRPRPTPPPGTAMEDLSWLPNEDDGEEPITFLSDDEEEAPRPTPAAVPAAPEAVAATRQIVTYIATAGGHAESADAEQDRSKVRPMLTYCRVYLRSALELLDRELD